MSLAQRRQLKIKPLLDVMMGKKSAPVHPVDKIVLMFDGGSRGNPGPSGAGYAIYKNGEETIAGYEPLGMATNNYAEYVALKIGLMSALKQGYMDITVQGDSLLVINQCRGDWAVKSDSIRAVNKDVMSLIARFEVVRLNHIPRTENKRADELANQAMDVQDSIFKGEANKSKAV